MELVNEKIIIKYQTAKEYCSCCSREFEIPEYGEVREFEITLGDLFKWTEWESLVEVHDEDVRDVVAEYLFDTISFYALNSNEKLKIVDGETNRVAAMILKTIEKE